MDLPFGLIFFLLSQRLVRISPIKMMMMLNRLKGRMWELPKIHIRYEEMMIPMTLVKIYPRSIKRLKISEVTGRQISPTKKIVSHQVRI